MAYVKTNWQTGDVITAAKLNNMETGIYDATEAAADAFAPDITSPQDGDTLVYDATAGKWVNGPGTNGGDFIITCTVTGQDFSGTINRTQAEINAAYAANKNFKISVPAMNLTAIPSVFTEENPGTESSYVRVSGIFMYYDGLGGAYLVNLATTDSQTYVIAMYPLTTNN